MAGRHLLDQPLRLTNGGPANNRTRFVAGHGFVTFSYRRRGCLTTMRPEESPVFWHQGEGHARLAQRRSFTRGWGDLDPPSRRGGLAVLARAEPQRRLDRDRALDHLAEHRAETVVEGSGRRRLLRRCRRGRT